MGTPMSSKHVWTSSWKNMCFALTAIFQIDLIVRENISAKCMACGWAGDLDNKHKLKKFVVRKPPDESGLSVRDSAAEALGGRLDRRARRAEKQRLAAMKRTRTEQT